MGNRHKAGIKWTNRLLIVIAAVISVVVVIYTYICIVNTNNLANYTESIYENNYKVMLNAMNYKENIMNLRETMYDMVENPENPRVEEGIKFLYESREAGSYSVEQIAAKNDSEMINHLKKQVDEIKQVHDRIISMVDQGNTEAAKNLLETRAETLYQDIESVLNTLIERGSGDIEFYVAKAQELNNNTNLTSYVLGALVIVFSVAASLVGARTIYTRNNEIYEREALFNVITENVDDIFLIYDLNKQQVEYVSDNVERVFGISAEELIYDEKKAVTGSVDEDIYSKIKEMVKKDNFVETAELEFMQQNKYTGEMHSVKCKMSPLADEEGQINKMICISRDVTSDIKSKNALQEALTAAQNAEAARRDFLSRVSHELRTPINAIVGMRAIAEMSMGDNEKIEDCLKKIDAASKYLLELVNDVLDMSKIESGNMKLDYGVFDLDNMLENISSIIYPRSVEKNQSFEIELLGVEQKIFFGDEMRIRQIVLNFLTNAVKFTPEGGRVRLVVEQGDLQDGCVYNRFAVYDNGPGIREEFMEKLFHPFEQDSVTLPRGYAGTGLGMAISKNLASMMGGDVSARKNPDGGAIFSFNLLLTVPQTKYVPPNERSGSAAKQLDFSGKRVLVAEDNEINMEIIEELLRAVGFEVDGAVDGKKAVEKFVAMPEGYYDIVLMDIQMPNMDGYNAARKIRDCGRADAKDTLIVAMSANAMPEEIAKSMNSGMNAHLAKPLDPQLMFSSIEALLDGHEKQS